MEEEIIKIPKFYLGRLLDSLETMIYYADDGSLNRNDEDFKEFFDSVDKANELLEKVYEEYYKGGF